MELAETLSNMLSGNNRAGNQIAEYCHKTAFAYLKYKHRNNDRVLDQLAISNKQLAWDCIAELFKRDENNQYIKFKEYFGDHDVISMTNHEVEMELRRLVFTKVNDGIFRNHGSVDPSLRKIIRNLKLAVKDDDELSIETIGNEKVLMITSAEENADLPSIPPEFLEIRLSNRINNKMQIPKIVKRVKTILKEQRKYQSSMNLSQLAVSIRRIFARRYDIEDCNTTNQSQKFLNSTLKMLIEHCITYKKEDFTSSYLDTKKLSEETFNVYFDVVEEILHNEYIKNDPDADSYYEHFKKQKPALSKEDYRENHRQYLEYFTKKTREELVTRLKKDHQYSAKQGKWDD